LATQSTITAAYQTTTLSIYYTEMAGPEVRADLARVENAADLGTALADQDLAATLAATKRLVLQDPGWHIVRLRVLSPSGRVLADVGGPYVLAPVRGHITYHGAVVGRFVMSVQDDVGYEKLVTRFTALPMELYRDGTPLMGRDFPASEAPAQVPPNGTAITVRGVKSVADSYYVLAFPNGHTDVLLAIPRASAALEADSCADVTAHTYGTIAADIAKQFPLPKLAASYIALDHGFDPAELLFVRKGGTQIASSGAQSGPVTIPPSGSVTYKGRSWIVYSFIPVRAVRVYILFPGGASPAAPAAPAARAARAGPHERPASPHAGIVGRT
jgi:hypothetical protein